MIYKGKMIDHKDEFEIWWEKKEETGVTSKQLNE